MSSAAGTGLVGLGLLLAARLLDVETLYPPGLALLVLAGGCAAWVWASARGAGVRRRPLPRRVTEGERVVTELAIRPGALPAPGGLVVDPLAPAGLPLGAVRGGRLRIATTFARRGVRTLAPPELRLRDPLGLARATVRADGPPDEVLVLPRIERVRSLGAGGGAGAGVRALGAEAAAAELDGLRPYRPGAPASRIHWPAVARGAGLIERRLRAEADARPLVVLDARAPRSAEDLDAAVRAAASLARALLRAGGCVLLLPGERRPRVLDGEGAWAAAHARLALVEAGGAAPAIPAGSVRTGTVVLVAARPLRDLPRGLAAAARGARILIVPGALEGRRPVLAVAGCHGYALRGAGGLAA